MFCLFLGILAVNYLQLGETLPMQKTFWYLSVGSCKDLSNPAFMIKSAFVAVTKLSILQLLRPFLKVEVMPAMT